MAGFDDFPIVAPASPPSSFDDFPVVGSPATPSTDPGFVANAARGLRMGLPFGNQFVAAEKTVLPQSLGGSQGFDYGKNLVDVNAADARLQQQHPVIADLGQGTGAALGALAVPAAALGEGAQGLGLLGRATRSGLTGAGLGAVQGAGAPGSDIRNLPQTEEGAVGGLYAGGALGAGFPVAGSAIGSVFTRGEVDPARQALVQTLRDVGIKPTAGQITGNQGLQKLEASISDIPFGVGLPQQENSKAFTAALMEKAGAPPGQIATSENLRDLHKSLGDRFNELGARNVIAVDLQLTSELSDAVTGYHDLTEGTPAPGVEKTATSLMDTVIPGDKYNNVRSQLGKIAQSESFRNPAQAQAYRDMQDALDSAMERSIKANNPGDLGAFQDVRSKYKNLVPIEQAKGSAGADAASGIISPQQMRTALASGNNRRAYARGIGDLAPLTNAGNAILTNFPQSGTTPRAMMGHALQTIGGLAGGLGGAPGGIEGAGLGAAAGSLAFPALAGRAIMSRPGQSILESALAKRLPAAQPRSMSRAAMAAALAANADLQAQRNQVTQQ